jgi:hypothetical protein
MNDHASRDTILRSLENRAEELTANQLDLLAQIEAHLRAVQHTMRTISTMRAAKFRIGPALSNGERLVALTDLAEQMIAIESHLRIQMETCGEMDRLIGKMLKATADARAMAQKLADTADPPRHESA